MVQQEGHLFIRFEKDLTFIQKYELTELLKTIPSNIILTFDFSRLHYIDEDNAAMLLQFIDEAPQHNIEVIIHKETPTLNNVLTASVYKLT
ncbi:MAG: STAS domain-containing protein [Saprospiraceae bacterium]